MGKYVAEMITHTDPLAKIAWLFFADRPETTFHRPLNVTSAVELFEIKGHRFHGWEQIGLPWRAKRAEVQVLHCTGSTLPYWQPVPTIVTLHDTLLWENIEPWSYESWYLGYLIPSALRKCAAVITISEASRRDILKLWPTLEDKLCVIPHGVSDAYLNAENQPLSPQTLEITRQEPYLLYIGGVLERKRFSWAAKVLAHLNQPDLRLLACGFTEEERDHTRRLLDPCLRKRISFLPFVQEDTMIQLYQHAAAVLYPTLYEGFGFPAVEAQAVGTPVLFSALGSLRELVGPAAEILPPEDLDSWVQTCKRLISQRSKVQAPNSAARTWARRFSWEASAARHLELYRLVAERKQDWIRSRKTVSLLH
jgi:alpha-1,3-rhamnosyl/mannosyltransferase